MKTLLFVFGTRPEAVKMCPIIKEIEKRGNINAVCAVSGQHKELLCDVLDAFRIVPQWDLSLMRAGQSLFDVTVGVLQGMESVIRNVMPSAVLVHGDTATAYATAVAAFYLGVPIAHVEAGLRTYDIKNPFPEEFYRRSIALVSQINFAPTQSAAENLRAEGACGIYVTGNTVVDALRYTVSQGYSGQLLDAVGSRRLVLVTAHRRESEGRGRREIFRAAREIAERYSDSVCVLLPAHPSPTVRAEIYAELNKSHVLVTDPLRVVDFHNLLSRAFAVITDSGGVQEEAASLGVPTLVARAVTERQEGVNCGAAVLTDACCEAIVDLFSILYHNEEKYKKMARAENPYGDGLASVRIADILEKIL